MILGSTGSIGRQTLDVIAQHAERFEVVGLVAGSNLDALTVQARQWQVGAVGLASSDAGQGLAGIDGVSERAVGIPEICALVEHLHPDLLVGAVSGVEGLAPVMTAISAGIDVALANKEPLVAAGQLVTRAMARSSARVLPIDSEISAVFQCMEGRDPGQLERVILTASGGAFRDCSKAELAQVTPAMALDHPTWRMGRKITVDSATLANKGFEVFELKWMFNLEFSQVHILIHHQSIVHSMVEFVDGSTLAQLTLPDMRFAIQYALTWPQRLPSKLPRMDLAELGSLSFAAPDFDKFPCLRLAYEAGKAGASYPAVLNAANERAVQLFLGERVKFTQIPELIERALAAHEPVSIDAPDDVMAVDAWARRRVGEMVDHGD